MNTIHAICEPCCRADLLKILVASSTTTGQCSVCGKPNQQVVETNVRDFILAIKALIRYHYSEFDYHSKLGGESFQTLLSVENPIIRINPKLDKLEYEDFLLSFLEDMDNDQQITLFTAYGRDIYNHSVMRAISEGESALIAAITEKLKNKNHFLVEDEYQTKLAEICEHVSISVDSGSVWHRARIGAKKRAADFDYNLTQESYYFEPYSNETLAAPPVGTTSAGRLNRPGVSYLYLASDQDTALTEVRPHPGEYVSLGSFSIKKIQRIADLSLHRLADHFRSDKELELLETIIAMETALATAAPPSNRQLYSLTQFLAEVFRKLGFDGVKFRSTVGVGANLVLFDPEAVNWVSNSSRVVEVRKVLYEHEDRKLFDPNEIYDIDFEASCIYGEVHTGVP
jgi:hypothetical protein